MPALPSNFHSHELSFDMDYVVELFREKMDFKGKPHIFRAPGHIQLMGATNGLPGISLQFPLDKGLFLVVSPRDDQTIQVYDESKPESFKFNLHVPYYLTEKHWLYPIQKVAVALAKEGLITQGFDILVYSNLPNKTGLVSAMAFESAVSLALLSMAHKEAIDYPLLQSLKKKAYPETIETLNPGLELLLAMKKKRNQALLINTMTQETQPVPINLTDCVFLVCYSGKQPNFGSIQAQRIAECTEALLLFQAFLPHIQTLNELTIDHFKQYSPQIDNPTLLKRVKHIITENERTLLAAQSLEMGLPSLLGKLLLTSQESLRDDYQVSYKELDLLIDIAAKESYYVTGSRIIGNGETGCTINLVHPDGVDEVQSKIATEYTQRTGLTPTFYRVKAHPGVSELDYLYY